MARTRLSRAVRGDSILVAAANVFAAHGYGGATTREIARVARVSEALLYRHFPSKRALYQAVLRRLSADQDANFAALMPPEPSTAGLVRVLHAHLSDCLDIGRRSRVSVGQRTLLLSLAADGRYARRIYTRALELGLAPFERALAAARRAGDLTGKLSATNAFWFIEHVGAMLISAHLGARPVIPYSGSRQRILREAVEFCGRGIGLSARAIAAHYPEK
jgi:AcrR family transcriptional regulator